MDKLSELKSAALAATPGPWARTVTRFNGITNSTHNMDWRRVESAIANANEKRDAIFIAAANPAVVLELLSALESKSAYASDWCNLATKRKDELDDANNRIAELSGLLAHNIDRAESAEKQLVYTRDAMATWERKAISNFEECVKMNQHIEELEKRLATPVQENGWINWHGGMFSPVRSDTVIDVMFANGNVKSNICAGSVVFEWQKTPKDSQRVTAYRIHCAKGNL